MVCGIEFVKLATALPKKERLLEPCCGYRQYAGKHVLCSYFFGRSHTEFMWENEPANSCVSRKWAVLCQAWALPRLGEGEERRLAKPTPAQVSDPGYRNETLTLVHMKAIWYVQAWGLGLKLRFCNDNCKSWRHQVVKRKHAYKGRSGTDKHLPAVNQQEHFCYVLMLHFFFRIHFKTDIQGTKKLLLNTVCWLKWTVYGDT